jgi:hypothetical protein
MTRVLSAALTLFVAAPAVAQAPPADKLPAGAKVVRLDVRPAAVALTGPFAYTQLLVTARLDDGTAVDVTRMATLSAPPNLVTVSPAGLVRPGADGSGDIAVSLGGQTVKVPVTVAGTRADAPVSFVTDVQPVLSKLGCNAGTCHGAQAGKNGFKLSLRGYDPVYDYRALTDDLEGRRFNRAAPERSLMLMKPAGAAPHQGGVMMQPGDPNYELVRRWIAQGVKFDPETPRVKGIAVHPQNPTVQRIGGRQQFAIVATYADGRTRDVTAEAFVESSNTEVATVDKTGLMTSVRRGEATMLARYEGAYAASTVVILGDRSGFQWEPRPVHNFIDELVDAKLKKVKVQPSPISDDAEFVRRVYLDLTGLPPSPEAVKAFLEDKRDTRAKRDELIDKLVGSEAFVEHWTNKWADLLQVNRKFLGDNGAAALRKWIRDAVANDMPYDKFAYTILTASGSNVENPPAAYFKVLRTPDAVMENTTQLFLAIRFNCNKCHDHPFERWTQDNYYNLAAYFAQVKLTEDPKFKGQKLGGTAVEGAKPLVELVTDQKAGDVKHDRTGEISPPKFPFQVKADIPAADPRRVQAAKWVTSPQNPYFAKSYVNRMWSYLLGVGVIEPVDDIRAGNPPTNPELLDRLTDEFVKGGFDTRTLIKTICKSRTYQLALATNKWNKDDEINYSHALARRLPAEVLFDAIHAATGSQSKLPGLPPGARAAQLVDSNVNLPGGFLELFGKPVRESACECERSGGLNLGPVLAMVNGPIVADAIKDPNNRITKIVLAERDDKKVVEGLYISVLNRFPTAAEVAEGVKALRSAGPDHAAMVKEHEQKVAAFEAYKKTLDEKQKVYEDQLRTQKPTNWVPLTVEKAVTKGGAKGSAKLAAQPDGSVLASGKADDTDLYTVTAKTDLKDPVTAIRLEVLADKSFPKNGPGRADSGNFVLNEFKLTYRAAAKPDEKPKPLPLQGAEATFSQDGYAVAGAIDNNPATGWAVFPQSGKDHAALFRFQKPVPAVKDGVAFVATLDQRFGTSHVIGKFRLSVTTDKNPRLASPLTAEELTLLDTPADERTAEQKAKLRAKYLAQDRDYQRLAAEAAKVPPSDPRVLGAQDLVWALVNSPAFLFNH